MIFPPHFVLIRELAKISVHNNARLYQAEIARQKDNRYGCIILGANSMLLEEGDVKVYAIHGYAEHVQVFFLCIICEV